MATRKRAAKKTRRRQTRARMVTINGERRPLADDIGRITIIDGRPHVCEMGFALRAGINTNRDPALAREAFLHFDLLEYETRPEPGEMFGSVPVFAWVDQAAAAKLMTLTTRQVANLEGKGLPHRGHGPTKQYPLPHLSIWHRQYIARGGSRGSVRRLSFELALAAHDAEMAYDRVRELEAAS